MQTNTWARGSAALFTILVTAGLAFAGTEPATKKINDFDEDDGTYAIETVTSETACKALCEADDTCRGTVLYQADISKPEMQCRLNNGLGSKPAFTKTEPDAIDFDKATADLNAYRISKGLKALTIDDRLNRAAEVHAKDIAAAGILSHTGTDGSGHGDRIQLQGYYFSIASENAAAGQPSWDRAFSGWQKSPGHNANMLRDDVSEFGVALAYEPTTSYRTYWVMVLAEPIDINAPVFAE